MLSGERKEANNFSETSALRLLLPWDLSYSIKATASEKKMAAKSLVLLDNIIVICRENITKKQRITNSTYKNTCLELYDELAILDQCINCSIAKLSETKTSLSTNEVKEYDDYFKISHIESNKPFLSLVFSLLQAVLSFLNLCHKAEQQLSYNIIEQQLNGFDVYRKLLIRTGDIECLL